jgi:micrococcal nuclease
MKKALVVTAILILFLASGVFAQDFTGKVLSVNGSDAITVMNPDNNTVVNVRLNCAVTPAQGQEFSTQAHQYLQKLLVGQNVEVNVVWQDHDNRDVSQLNLNGKDVGCSLAGAGLAWYDSRYQQDGQIAVAQAQAQAQRIGIWSAPNPVAPWVYLTNQRDIVPNTSLPPTNIGGKGYGAPAANKDLDAGTSWEQNPQPLDTSGWGAGAPYAGPGGPYWHYGDGALNPNHQQFCNYCNGYHGAGRCGYSRR